MGKRTSKVGITGLSRFVNIFTENQVDMRTGPTTFVSENPIKPVIQRTDDSCGDKNETVSKLVPSADRHKLGNGSAKCDMTGLVPFYDAAAQVPEHLQKYFSQRLRYFSLYDKPPGCLLDEEGWYSVTPERIANQIAERCRCDVVVDAFCGVGGNAIAFAKTCERVIALDTNPTRLALARHNAQIYGVADRIEFIQADYISFARAYLTLGSSDRLNTHRKIDVVFLSPPWGGPSYLSGSTPPESVELDMLQHPSYSLASVQPIHGKDLFILTRKITPNVAYYLPRNTCLAEISSLLKDTGGQGNSIHLSEEQIEVEEEWMGDKLKALTCYFGGLVAGQGHRF